MNQEKPQPQTWQQIKDFVNSIPEHKLQHIAYIIVEDSSKANALLEPFFMDRDIWVCKDEYEDSGTLEDLRELHGDNLKEEDYVLATPKGTPFLWTE